MAVIFSFDDILQFLPPTNSSYRYNENTEKYVNTLVADVLTTIRMTMINGPLPSTKVGLGYLRSLNVII